MNDLTILYHGEIQILGWGESRNQGKYLKIRLFDMEGDPLEPFRGLDGPNDKSLHILNATITEGDILEKPHEDYGKIASKLYANGFFLAPKVLEAIGTDEQFRQWIQRQPSAISGSYSEYLNGEGFSIAAHVRRSTDSGTGYKPKYACIPLTQDEHMLKHQQGEEILKPREWWDKQRQHYVTQWAKQALLKKLSKIAGHDYSGFGEVPTEILRDWAQSHFLQVYLPIEYR